MSKTYQLKPTSRVDFVFGPAPAEFPHGKVEICQPAIPPIAGVVSVQAVGVYLGGFNRHPIRYHVTGAMVRQGKGRAFVPGETLAPDQREAAKAIILGQ